jgi:1,2-diacylglycerol 3-beta-glucosyltransferase
MWGSLVASSNRNRYSYFMMDVLLLIFSTLYALGMLVFALVAMRTRYPTRPNARPPVAVIVAARNEERNIGRCLDSLVALEYPSSALDIVIVDDGSTDRTAEIVRSYVIRYPHVRLILAGPPSGHLRGKTNAVAQAFDVARGEIVLLTDADCAVPPRWVEETVKYYVDEGVGLVPGFTEISGETPFHAMQTMDWFSLFSVAAATTRMGIPLTAVGTNFSIRRSAYDAVGGYRAIPFSITEDYALFHAVVSTKKYRACFPIDSGALVVSEPCRTWRELYRQRKRWFAGGSGMDMTVLACFLPAWAMHGLIPAALVLGYVPAGLGAIAVKFAADFIMAIPSLLAFRRGELLWVFPLYFIYFYLYVLIFPPISFLSPRVRWKDRSIPR